MRFYLGTHHGSQRWFDLGVPLFVSRRVFLAKESAGVPDVDHDYFRRALLAEAGARFLRASLPRAVAGWALDSGGFTELSLYGEWRTSEDAYVADVLRLRDEVGEPEWVAPMDWMCEPAMLAKTGLDVAVHQRLTVENFVRLRGRLGRLVIPVLQGWTVDDYLRCWERYHRAGVDLEWEDVVGLGTVCRRQNTAEAGLIVRRLADNLLGRQLHGFGVKITGLESFGDVLGSADSLAWSFDGRRLKSACPEGKASCANCVHHALAWRENLVARLGQQRLAVACNCPRDGDMRRVGVRIEPLDPCPVHAAVT